MKIFQELRAAKAKLRYEEYSAERASDESYNRNDCQGACCSCANGGGIYSKVYSRDAKSREREREESSETLERQKTRVSHNRGSLYICIPSPHELVNRALSLSLSRTRLFHACIRIYNRCRGKQGMGGGGGAKRRNQTAAAPQVRNLMRM